MSLIVENAFLFGADGLIQSGDQIWFHFQKYPWHLSCQEKNPGTGMHRRIIESRLRKGLPKPSFENSLVSNFQPPDRDPSGQFCHIFIWTFPGTEVFVLESNLNCNTHPVYIPGQAFLNANLNCLNLGFPEVPLIKLLLITLIFGFP
mgnify:CR=1 FL=1